MSYKEITPEYLAEIEARAENATHGEWEWDGRTLGATRKDERYGVLYAEINRHNQHVGIVLEENDADFIVHARQDILALCEAWRTERTYRDHWHKKLIESLRKERISRETMRERVEIAVKSICITMIRDAPENWKNPIRKCIVEALGLKEETSE